MPSSQTSSCQPLSKKSSKKTSQKSSQKPNQNTRNKKPSDDYPQHPVIDFYTYDSQLELALRMRPLMRKADRKWLQEDKTTAKRWPLALHLASMSIDAFSNIAKEYRTPNVNNEDGKKTITPDQTVDVCHLACELYVEKYLGSDVWTSELKNCIAVALTCKIADRDAAKRGISHKATESGIHRAIETDDAIHPSSKHVRRLFTHNLLSDLQTVGNPHVLGNSQDANVIADEYRGKHGNHEKKSQKNGSTTAYYMPEEDDLESHTATFGSSRV